MIGVAREKRNERYTHCFATYVEDGNGTKEEWDLHDLSVTVITDGSLVVVIGAAVSHK